MCVRSVCGVCTCVCRSERGVALLSTLIELESCTHALFSPFQENKKKCVCGQKKWLRLNISSLCFCHMHLNRFQEESSSFIMWGETWPHRTCVTGEKCCQEFRSNQMLLHSFFVVRDLLGLVLLSETLLMAQPGCLGVRPLFPLQCLHLALCLHLTFCCLLSLLFANEIFRVPAKWAVMH